MKYLLLSPTERALLLARCQGPRPLPAVLLTSRPFTPSAISAARRRRGVFHCRHRADRSRSRTQRVRAMSTSEAEIADPTPHIRGKLFHCRLDAETLGPARDFSGSSLEPFQGLWRDDALDVWTGRKAVSRPAGLHHQPLAELCVTLSRHTAPIRRTYRSYRAASARKVSRFPELVFQESDSHEPCEL